MPASSRPASAGATTLAAPPSIAQTPIKWRLQTYAGAALGEHVTKPAVDMFNKAAKGEMEIELYYADQIVPTGELFRALQAARSTRCIPTTIRWPRRSRSRCSAATSRSPPSTSSTCRCCSSQYGLADIWRDAYAKAGGVVWLSAAGQDPCHFNTKKAINSLADLQGLRLYTFPTAGRFLAQFGVVPVIIPYEDVAGRGADRRTRRHGLVGHHRGLHGRLGRRDRLLPDQQHLGRLDRLVLRQREEVGGPAGAPQAALVMAAIEAGHTYRNQWYWGGEAKLRANGDKLELTHDSRRRMGRGRERGQGFLGRDRRKKAKCSQKIVDVFKEYNEVMNQAGRPTPSTDRKIIPSPAAPVPRRSPFCFRGD